MGDQTNKPYESIRGAKGRDLMEGAVVRDSGGYCKGVAGRRSPPDE